MSVKIKIIKHKLNNWEGASDKAKETVAKILLLIVLMFGASEIIENNRPKLVFEQRGCVVCDTMEESKPEMAEDNSSDDQVAIKPKAQEESTRLEADSHSVKKLVEEKGKEVFGEEEVPALIELIDRESDFNHTAQNPTSTAYGLFQFLDGTWGKYGEKTSDPNKQIEYGLKYIKDRYQTPSKALAYHNQNNSY